MSVLACSLPETFALKDNSGNYWCLNDDGHLHTEDKCPNNFKTNNRHKFRLVKSEDNGNVPSGKCGIQSAFDDSFLMTKGGKGQLERGDSGSLENADYHFAVNDVGNGKVNIFSIGKNKYMKKEGHHAKSKENSDCGETCRFTFEDFAPPGMLSKENVKDFFTISLNHTCLYL